MRFALRFLRFLVLVGVLTAFIWGLRAGLQATSLYREASRDGQVLIFVLAATLVWGIVVLSLWLWRRARSWREKRRSG